ncbi:MAG: HDIG domain-containing metalloprotein [bacterium]
MKLKIKPKYFILIGIFLLLNIIFPPPKVPTKYSVNEGEIAISDIIATYDFLIPKTEQELYEEKNEIAARIPPVFEFDNAVHKMVLKKLSGLQSLIDSLHKIASITEDSLIFLVQKEYALDGNVIRYLVRNQSKKLNEELLTGLGDIYSVGVVESKPPNFRIITIVSGDKEIVESIEKLHSVSEAENILSSRKRAELQMLVSFLITPNVIYNEQKTEKRIEDVFSNVPKTKGKILKGEIIVEKHKRVTKEAKEIITALEGTYISVGTWEIFKTMFFRNLLYFAALFFLLNIGIVKRTPLFLKKNVYFMALLTAVYLVIGKVTLVTDTLYLLPISFFILLFALYFDTYIAVAMALVFASIFGIVLNSMPVFVFLLTSGLVAAFSSRTISSRLSLYRPIIYIAIANIAAILFSDLYLLKGNINFWHFGEGILNSIMGSVLFVLLLPLFEKIFDFCTDLTLLEQGNLNLPMFKEMAMETPGTYHHSIIVGSLAEAASRTIGADPILARVGAYYHDIGKLKKPEYFIENQIGVKNPHDNLKPQMSTLIIISHVKEGVEMAKKMKLPKKLIDIIEQHHGTTAIELFYNKALDKTPDISMDTFRYPGPKPKTKESAVVMLADTVEAAARSEKNITVTKLQRLLKDNIEKKFADGQLDECPITRHDLESIKTAFLSILTGVFHPRVEYEQNNAKISEKRSGNNKKS